MQPIHPVQDSTRGRIGHANVGFIGPGCQLIEHPEVWRRRPLTAFWRLSEGWLSQGQDWPDRGHLSLPYGQQADRAGVGPGSESARRWLAVMCSPSATPAL